MREIPVPQRIKSEKLRNSDFELFFFDDGTKLKIPYEIKQPLHNRSYFDTTIATYFSKKFEIKK